MFSVMPFSKGNHGPVFIALLQKKEIYLPAVRDTPHFFSLAMAAVAAL